MPKDAATIIGPWDTVFSLPSDSTPGALTTGEGEAWSMPHADNEVKHGWMEDGGYFGGAYAPQYNGASTWVNCGSGATLDNLGAAGATVQVEGWFRCDCAASTQEIFHKGQALSTGFMVYVGATGKLTGYVPLATTNAQAEADDSVWDGKWHHYVFSYNDTTKSLQMALDGKWGTADVGVGAYQADAASNWEFGRLTNLSSYLEGAIGWHKVWNAAHYTPDTDFIPTRTFASAGTVEAWAGAEGTGATLTASITTPGNDGAITDGVWDPQWDIEGTPLIPASIEYNGEDTSCVVADAAPIQDLHDGAMCAEAWIRADGCGESNSGRIFDKADPADGWQLFLTNAGGLRGRVFAATYADSVSGTDEFTPDGKWHHFAFQFDDGGDRKIYLWVDGIPVASYTTQAAAVGAILTDVGNDLYHGSNSTGNATFEGFLGGWARLSNILRYTNGKAFVPNSRFNPPAPDANTKWQTDYSDGAGATLTDDSGNANDGTLSNYEWKNTPDMEVDASGEMNYNQGYDFGVDAVDEGITQIKTGMAAGDDFVCLAMLHPDASSRGQLEVEIYDEIGAAAITTFTGPKYTGTHTGGGGDAVLEDSANRIVLPNIVGWALYNITDGSSTTVTAYNWDGTDTFVTGVLAGGTDDDWDAGDVYRLVPPRGYDKAPWVECFTFENPAGCTSWSAKILNVDDEGSQYTAQAIILSNLLSNGSLEGGAGNPYIPTGWTSVDLDLNDTLTEATIIHSGAESLEFAVGASAEGIRQAIVAAAGSFIQVGMWSYGSGDAGFTIGGLDATKLLLQYSATAFNVATPHTAVWSHTQAVFRVVDANPDIYILADAGAGDLRYIDDISVF